MLTSTKKRPFFRHMKRRWKPIGKPAGLPKAPASAIWNDPIREPWRRQARTTAPIASKVGYAQREGASCARQIARALAFNNDRLFEKVTR